MGLIGLNPSLKIGNQGLLARAIAATAGHGFTKFRAAEFGHTGHKIAQNIGKVFVHIGLEINPSKLAVRGFRRMTEKPPAPVIWRQNFQSLIHEDATALTGGELAAVIVEVVEGFNVIDQLPRLARP